MSIRKEQVLLILVVLLGAWIASDYLQKPGPTRGLVFSAEEYEATEVDEVALVTSPTPELVRRDLMTEPSETRPLPPRELAFPPRDVLSMAGLPLDPGPDFGHSWLLSRDGAIVDGVTVDPAGAGALADNGAGGTNQPTGSSDQGPQLGGLSTEQKNKLYDRIWLRGQGQPLWVRIEPREGVDLYALEEATSGALDGVELIVRRYNSKDNTLGRPQSFGVEAGRELDRIQLADTVRNAVERMRRKVKDGPSYQAQRLALIHDLLDMARENSWIYDAALEEATTYMQMAGAGVEGRSVMQLVLQARGDIGEEFELLEGSTGSVARDAFRLRGLGELKARFGLWVEAEQDLRGAVAQQPTDARNHAALARFLLGRGRSQEAEAAADRAERAIGGVQDADTRRSIQRTMLACRLAVGKLDAAQQLSTSLGSDYLRGCVHYARGAFAEALSAFRIGSVGPDRAAATIGQAACLCETGEWQQACELFTQVADEAPLLRHRALSGLAMLYSRIGQFEDALGYCDRALEAAPKDAYVLYLRGRTLRLMGQLTAAEHALEEALHVRDDFGHAIAEMSSVQSQLANGLVGEGQAEALVAARRYIDRAVALSPSPRLELLELQGLRAFAAADWRAARAAFERAREHAGTDQKQAWSKGALAVVAYSRGRTAEAKQNLDRLERDLGRDNPIAEWAGKTVAAIDEHELKEALSDTFDREKAGDIWSQERDGRFGMSLDDGRLVYDGTFQSGEVWAQRVGAVPSAKNFLAVKVDMEIGPDQTATETFVGLGIAVSRGGSARDVTASVGVYDGVPFYEIRDGVKDGEPREIRNKVDLPLRVGPQELEIRVVPRSEDDVQRLNLIMWFNGSRIVEHELEQLTRTTGGTELRTLLFARGNSGSRVDVAFDNYELERIKDIR